MDPVLDKIIHTPPPMRWLGGTAGLYPASRQPVLILESGLKLSIQASTIAHCTPKDNVGPYSEVEVGAWSPLAGLEDYCEDPDAAEGDLRVYPYVPVEELDALVARHGGIVPADTAESAAKVQEVEG